MSLRNNDRGATLKEQYVSYRKYDLQKSGHLTTNPQLVFSAHASPKAGQMTPQSTHTATNTASSQQRTRRMSGLQAEFENLKKKIMDVENKNQKIIEKIHSSQQVERRVTMGAMGRTEWELPNTCLTPTHSEPVESGRKSRKENCVEIVGNMEFRASKERDRDASKERKAAVKDLQFKNTQLLAIIQHERASRDACARELAQSQEKYQKLQLMIELIKANKLENIKATLGPSLDKMMDSCYSKLALIDRRTRRDLERLDSAETDLTNIASKVRRKEPKKFIKEGMIGLETRYDMLLKTKDQECKGMQIRLRMKQKQLIEAQSTIQKLRKSSKKSQQQTDDLKLQLRSTSSLSQTRCSPKSTTDKDHLITLLQQKLTAMQTVLSQKCHLIAQLQAQSVERSCSPRDKLDVSRELADKVEQLAGEKKKLELSFQRCRDEKEVYRGRLGEADAKVRELQEQLDKKERYEFSIIRPNRGSDISSSTSIVRAVESLETALMCSEKQYFQKALAEKANQLAVLKNQTSTRIRQLEDDLRVLTAEVDLQIEIRKQEVAKQKEKDTEELSKLKSQHHKEIKVLGLRLEDLNQQLTNCLDQLGKSEQDYKNMVITLNGEIDCLKKQIVELKAKNDFQKDCLKQLQIRSSNGSSSIHNSSTIQAELNSPSSVALLEFRLQTADSNNLCLMEQVSQLLSEIQNKNSEFLKVIELYEERLNEQQEIIKYYNQNSQKSLQSELKSDIPKERRSFKMLMERANQYITILEDTLKQKQSVVTALEELVQSLRQGVSSSSKIPSGSPSNSKVRRSASTIHQTYLTSKIENLNQQLGSLEDQKAVLKKVKNTYRVQLTRLQEITRKQNLDIDNLKKTIFGNNSLLVVFNAKQILNRVWLVAKGRGDTIEGQLRKMLELFGIKN